MPGTTDPPLSHLLPTETYQHILSFCDGDTLGRASLVSLAFLELASPHLYGHIIITGLAQLKAVDELLRKQRVQLGNRVAASTKEGILSVIKEVRRGGQVGIPADPEPAESAGIFVPFFATQALTSKFVPNMLAGHKAVGVFLHALRLPDGSGYKVILEAAPEEMYSTDTATSCAAMSKVVERYVGAYPSQYMWSMKRFKKRPPGEERWY